MDSSDFLEIENSTPLTDEVIEATELNFSDLELSALVGNLSMDFIPVDSVLPTELKGLLRQLIEGRDPTREVSRAVHERMDLNVGQGLSLDPRHIKNAQGVSLFDYFQEDFESAKKLLIKGQCFVLRRDRKAVSMIMYRQACAELPDGRKIYEMKKMSTIDGYTGRGFNRKLSDHCFQFLRQKYPDAVIALDTLSQTVKNYCGRLPGWQSAGSIFSDHPLSKTLARAMSLEELEDLRLHPYEVFFFDPAGHAGEF